MSLPDFLIIGAMKAGTTSLYHDLRLNPVVFLSDDKEPGNLCHDEVLTETGKRAYEKLFDKANPKQLCGEASTAYSKLPDVPGVPQRAKRLLGANLKVIYIVRDPIARIISQHHHEITSKRISCNIDEAVRSYARFIDFSRYAMQIKPWIESLGRDNVLIVHFETYINKRKDTVESISRFLDIEPQTLGIDQDEVFNKTTGKPVPQGLIAKLRFTSVYRRLLRPMFSTTSRDSIRKALLPHAHARPVAPTSETAYYIKNQICTDIEEITGIMQSSEALWETLNNP